MKRTRRWWRGCRESVGYRGSRPCNLRRDIAEANIGITHCSQPLALALNPLVLCLLLAKGHTCSVKGALVSLLIRHVGLTALRLSRPGDSSLTTEPASGCSDVTQSEELLVVLGLKLSLCTSKWNCGWSSSYNPEWVGEPVNHFAHVQWLNPSAHHCCGIELVHWEPCSRGS